MIVDSSTERHEAFSKFAAPKTKSDVVNMLGDQSGKNHTVFRDNGIVRTIAAGNKSISQYDNIPMLNCRFHIIHFFHSI